jgi:hypothetical protein
MESLWRFSNDGGGGGGRGGMGSGIGYSAISSEGQSRIEVSGSGKLELLFGTILDKLETILNEFLNEFDNGEFFSLSLERQEHKIKQEIKKKCFIANLR